LWSINKFESIGWIITFLGVVLLDVDFGLLIGIAISIFMVVIRDKFFQLRNLIDYKSNFVDENLIINDETKLEVILNYYIL
jgi:MFS superfamily sulfate permease-like transporter